MSDAVLESPLRHSRDHYFQVSECPLSNECTPENWKKWRVWGWTEQEALEQCRAHLTRGLHRCSEEEVVALMAGVQLEVVDARRQLGSQVPPVKRQRHEQQQRQQQHHSSSDQSRGSGGQIAVDVEDVVHRTVRAVMGQTQHRPQQLSLVRQVPASRESTITMSTAEFSIIIDSVGRAAAAAKQAGRMAAAAATAFESEAGIFAEICDALKTMRSHAESGME